MKRHPQEKKSLLLLISAYEYYCARDYDEAVAEYNRAIAIWPFNAYYYLMRGRAFAKAGERDKGIEDLKTALAMEGDNKDFLKTMEKAEQNKGIWKENPAVVREGAINVDRGLF